MSKNTVEATVARHASAPRAVDWTRAREIAHAVGAERASAFPIATTSVPLADAAGKTLARDLLAKTMLPGFSSSAMDGWAISGNGPWTLGAPIFAGDRPSLNTLEAGTARPISTGAPIPPGTTAVLRREHGDVITARDGGMLQLNAFAAPGSPREGEHVRLAGEEATIGDLLIPAGVRLTTPRLALAAVAGFDHLEVVGAADIDLLLLGDEILYTGVPEAGSVRDAFRPSLPSAFTALGARLMRTYRTADNHRATVAALLATAAPIVITTGGTSHGDADFVRSALVSLGARVLFDGVAMRPGHPVMLAVLPDDRLVLSLPGNPLAAMACFASLGVPLIDGLLGRRSAPLGIVTLATSAPNASSSTRLVPCVLDESGLATPTGWQGSGMVRGLASADAVVVIPAGGRESGDVVETLPLPW